MGTVFMDKRVTALLEVSSMVFLVILTSWLFEVYLGWFMFWGWCFKVFMVLIALFIVILLKRSFRTYGFIPKNLYFTLKWSTMIVGIFVVPTVILIMILSTLNMIKPAGLSLLGIILNVIFLMIFVGLIEEVYFRGYIQSRLNEVFEKRWSRFIFRVWRVNYGLGLLLTSTAFALIHIVNYWNPLVGRWEPTWWIPIHILGCFAFGCLAGVLREASGDIYVPASLHGVVMTAYTFLNIYTNELVMNISLFISWFIFFYLLAYLFDEAENLTRRGCEGVTPPS